jgi:predicted nucleic acid-binding protein
LAVITEAACLLWQLPEGLSQLLKLIVEQVVVCVHLDETAANWIMRAVEKYRDLQPQVADLSLLYLAQSLKIEHVFTLDRRDFSVYQKAVQPALILLPENYP